VTSYLEFGLIPQTEEEVRKQIEARRGRPVLDLAWDLLVAERVPGTVIDGFQESLNQGHEELEAAYAKYIRVEKTVRAAASGGRSSVARPRGTSSAERDIAARRARGDALAQLVAMTIDADEAVRNFRRRELGEGLLTHETAPAWIVERAQAETYEGNTVWVEIPIDVATGPRKGAKNDGWRAAVKTGAARLHERGTAPRRRLELLAFWDETLRETHRVPVRFDGALEWLKAIAGDISARFPSLREEDAVSAVLTGRVPMLAGSYAQTWRSSEFPAAGSITIEATPRLRPSEVQALFSAAREELLAGATRDRPLDEITLNLVLFAVARNDGRPWREVVEEWNQLHPDQAYRSGGEANWRRFGRDVREGYRRLTGGARLPWGERQED
jgi:hypothetical protein